MLLAFGGKVALLVGGLALLRLDPPPLAKDFLYSESWAGAGCHGGCLPEVFGTCTATGNALGMHNTLICGLRAMSP
jgi:hypothetical protein